ncbi:MAG: hypothetical protein DWQ20_00880 [Actinobacteria bacterium]|nr:MAG: hypothetical protein DWQ20_00880 [Actinomycetota bacterium]
MTYQNGRIIKRRRGRVTNLETDGNPHEPWRAKYEWWGPAFVRDKYGNYMVDIPHGPVVVVHETEVVG